MIRIILLVSVAAVLILFVARPGVVRAHWGPYPCATGSGVYSNYAERWIGPNTTHFVQYSGTGPYHAKRKTTAGTETYSYYVDTGRYLGAHFDFGDQYRLSGEKNGNGGSYDWFVSHYSAPGGCSGS